MAWQEFITDIVFHLMFPLYVFMWRAPFWYLNSIAETKNER